MVSDAGDTDRYSAGPRASPYAYSYIHHPITCRVRAPSIDYRRSRGAVAHIVDRPISGDDICDPNVITPTCTSLGALPAMIMSLGRCVTIIRIPLRIFPAGTHWLAQQVPRGRRRRPGLEHLPALVAPRRAVAADLLARTQAREQALARDRRHLAQPGARDGHHGERLAAEAARWVRERVAVRARVARLADAAPVHLVEHAIRAARHVRPTQ